MDIKVLLFGSLADAAGSGVISVETERTDTEGLVTRVEEKFPLLKEKTYRIAVNGEIIDAPRIITRDSEIAFLPPFAGG